jgi:glycosyltransferase involved in cell wall biosynthesis
LVVGWGAAAARGGPATARLVTELQTANIPVLQIEHFMRNMSPLRDIKAFFEVWRLLRKEKPDILHLSSSKAGGIGALAGRLAGTKRIIFTSHGLTVDETWRPRWQRILIYLSTWATLRLCHQSIMINTETFKRASNMPGLRDRVTLIKNGIAPITFLSRTAARAKLAPHLPRKALWIGGIGELHPNKNWSIAIEALANLPAHIHLFIIGEGEEREKLTQLTIQRGLQDRVHLPGFLIGAPYLPAFDVFLLPSLKEGLPYVLLEAGLAGLPVVASDLPGNRDIIDSGETGLLVTPTANELTASLQILCRDEGMRRRLGTTLQEHVTTHFSTNSMFTATEACYANSPNSSALKRATE